MGDTRERTPKGGQTPIATPAFVRRVQLTYSVRAQLILLALFIALPLLIGSAVRIATRWSDGQKATGLEVQRVARLVAERVEERVRSAEALLIGLTPALRLDTLQMSHNDSVFAQTLSKVPQRYANFFAFDKSCLLYTSPSPRD